MGRQGRSSARSDLCADAHKALKADDRRWKQAAFAGYQPLGRLLGEYRMCSACRSTVLRPASFVDALDAVLEYLTAGQAHDIVYLKSAALLSGWARENIPAWFGLASGPPELPPSSPMAAVQSSRSTKRRRSSRLRRGQARLADRRRRSRVGACARALRAWKSGE